MNDIGVFTPDQARALWQDYQQRRMLTPQISQNYPQRRPIDELSPHRVFVQNNSGETCPAYGCLQITGTATAGGRTVITIDKPDSTTSEYLFNSQFEIADGGTGWAYRYGVVVAIGSAPATPNTVYQPTSGQWTIEEGGSLFTVFGAHNAAANGLIGKFAGGGTSSLQYGIVNADETRGYYTIEIAEWAGTTPVAGEVPDICLDATGSTSASGDDSCADITLPAFESQLIGTGVYVLAYDPESVFVPLEVGSDCVLADMGATNALGSQSASSGTTEPVFQIVRGYQTHVVAYDKQYVCCDGVWTLITKKTYIFAAKECTPAQCANCP